MRKMNDLVEKLAVMGYVGGIRAKEKAGAVLKRNEGEGFVDTACASVRA